MNNDPKNIVVILLVAASIIGLFLSIDNFSKNSVKQKKAVFEEIKKPHKKDIKKSRTDKKAEDKKDAAVKTDEKKFEKKSNKIALIIDDLGYSKKMADKFLALDKKLTVSIIPFTPHSEYIAEKAERMNLEIMLHLPMEPISYPKVNPGENALFSNMTKKNFKNTLDKNLNAFASISGVNNHMGSKLTIMREPMEQVLEELKKRNLYFIDSRTTHNTICREVAKLTKIRFAERDSFLDSVPEKKEILKQIKKLLRKAEKSGSAVGICHPRPLTLKVLKEQLPLIKEKVEIVPASYLAKVVK